MDCAWSENTCKRNECSLKSEKECSAGGECAWNSDMKVCVRPQCSADNEEDCKNKKEKDIFICKWTIRDNGVAGCAPKDIDAMSREMAAAQNIDAAASECSPTEKNMTPLAIVMVVIVVILAGVAGWMIYRQRMIQKATDYSKMLDDEGDALEGDNGAANNGDTAMYQQTPQDTTDYTPVAPQQEQTDDIQRTSL